MKWRDEVITMMMMMWKMVKMEWRLGNDVADGEDEMIMMMLKMVKMEWR